MVKFMIYDFDNGITALLLTCSPEQDCRLEPQLPMILKILFSRTMLNKLLERSHKNLKIANQPTGNLAVRLSSWLYGIIEL